MRPPSTPPRWSFLIVTLCLLSLGLVPAHAHEGQHDAAMQPGEWRQVLGPDPDAAYALAVEAGLFGRFTTEGALHQGDLVTFTNDASGGAVADLRHEDTLLIERLEIPLTDAVRHVDGSVVVLENATSALTVHDNRHAWVSFRGHAERVVLTLPADATGTTRETDYRIETGDRSYTLHHAEADERTVHADENGTVTILEPDGWMEFTLSLDAGIWDAGIRPGGWILGARVGDTAVFDIAGTRPMVRPIASHDEGRLSLGLTGGDADESGARALQIDTVGVFPHDLPGRFLVHLDGRSYFQDTAEDTVWRETPAPAWKNVSQSEAGPHTLTSHRLRVPAQIDDELVLAHDARPPQILNTREDNLTGTWDPTERVPHLITRTDEPALGRLLIEREGAAPFEKPTVVPAFEQRYRLNGLAPDTTYAYTIVLTDMAGNQNETTGTFTTPPQAKSDPPQITITPAEAPAVLGQRTTLRATVTDAAGTPWPASRIAVFFDKTTVTQEAIVTEGAVTYITPHLEAGPHSFVVEAAVAGQDTVMASHRFEVATEASGPGAAVLALGLVALLACGRSRSAKPRP